jgi:hypothetical protein
MDTYDKIRKGVNKLTADQAVRWAQICVDNAWSVGGWLSEEVYLNLEKLEWAGPHGMVEVARELAWEIAWQAACDVGADGPDPYVRGRQLSFLQLKEVQNA